MVGEWRRRARSSATVVLLIGRECPSAAKIASDLVGRDIQTSWTPWDRLSAEDCTACILLSPPEDQAGRSALASLVQRSTPLFYLSEHPVYNLYGRDKIVPLPCRFDAKALAVFLSWFEVPGRGAPAEEPTGAASGSQRSAKREAARRREDDEAGRAMVEEMRLASELQKSLLPRATPSQFPINVTHKYVPYQFIGGDFFDIVALDDTRMGLVIADASGHGVPAAFLTAMFKSAFSLFALEDPSPAVTMGKLNAEFIRTIHTDHYLTAFYAVIDTETMRCTYCNAGHPKQLLLRRDGTVSELTSMGFLLGSIDAAQYGDESIRLAPGDRIVLFTDGVIETNNGEQEQFGRQRIADVLVDNPNSSIEDLSNSILSELVMFMEQPVFGDDVTILIAEVMESL